MLENAGLQYCTQLPSQDTSVKFNFTFAVSLENKLRKIENRGLKKVKA